MIPSLLSRAPGKLVFAAVFGICSANAESASGVSIEGNWLGTVRASETQVAEIGFGFHTPVGGKIHMTFYMPAMHVYGVDLGPVTVNGGTVDFRPLDARLALNGDRLTGTFAKAALPVDLRRGGVFKPEPPLPAYPSGPAPRWSSPLGAGAWASPVVWDGIVYIGTDDGRLHALNAGD